MNVVWEPIIAAILAITNFSIQANPKAPDAAAVLEHVVDDADVVVHLDWKTTVADNYATFSKLAEDPVIKQVPELRDAVRQGLTQAEGGRAMAKAMIGFDPVDDLSSITAFAKLQPGGQPPEFLVVVRGKLAADLPAKIARTAGGKETKIDGRIAATMPDGTTLGFAKSGALLAGKGEWVTARLKDDWKAPARAKGSPWARIATALDSRPFFLVASKPSAAALQMMTQTMDPSFGKDVVAGHDLLLVSATSTGFGWVYAAKDAALARRMKSASEGVIDLLRAAHLAPRGMAQLVSAALPSYARTSKGIDAVLASKDQLMTAMWSMTGDGKFAATVKLEGNAVVVTTKAKRISEIVPASALVGFGVLGAITARGTVEHDAPAPPPVRAVTPRTGGGITAPAKPPVKKPAPAPAPVRR
ncbi:MAG TPA: hypothetical protein VM734_14930 [Kofleriaceae bacterium]|nr:hypothetical protein [Kofleriaceae bacterium]